jgi:hypothetical protein
LNEEESEKIFKKLNVMKGLKSSYVVELIDSWIEENSLKIEDFMKSHSNSGISSSHPILDPINTVLLHIQMEFISQSLNEVIKQLSNELRENASKTMKTLGLTLVYRPNFDFDETLYIGVFRSLSPNIKEFFVGLK